jgi:ABC-type sugar transport system ATPase subunit
MASVIFENVLKSFGSVKAVNDVSLTINDGEFLCLLGPSGCGKTTTLRLIAGLEQATSGTIKIGTKNVTNVSPKDRDVGMVFQDYALYPHMTLLENIAYPLKVRKVEKSVREEKVKEVAQRLYISHLMERLPGQISGGQQQRTSVARAVVHEPQVFLFDEPLSNLDAKLRLESRVFIRHLQQQLKVTAVYVTHDQAEAMAIADRIAVMQDGVIVQIGTPLEIYRRPATAFVANFLGSPPMNLIDVTYVSEVFRSAAGSLDPAMLGYHKKMLNENAAYQLGIRPEHVFIGDVDEGPTIQASLYGIERLGPESILSFTVGDSLFIVRVYGDEEPEVSLGEEYQLSFSRDNVHLFDASGNRV